MQSSVAVLSSPIVDGKGPIVSDTTALVFISGGNKMPVASSGLEAGSFRLLYVAAEIEFGAGKRDDAVETFFYLRRQVAPPLHSFRFAADRLQRLHEVSLFQFAGVVR